MRIAVLDHSTTNVIVYEIDSDDARQHMVEQLEDDGYEKDWESLDDNDIVEMWLKEIKHHRMSDIHYMTGEFMDYNLEAA